MVVAAGKLERAEQGVRHGPAGQVETLAQFEIVKGPGLVHPVRARVESGVGHEFSLISDTLARAFVN